MIGDGDNNVISTRCPTAILMTFASLHNRRRNMDLPKYTRDQAAVETVALFDRIDSEENQAALTNKVMLTAQKEKNHW